MIGLFFGTVGHYMKWLSIILSIASKQFMNINNSDVNPILEIKKIIAENTFKALFGFAFLSMTILLFVSGILIIVINTSAQYDAGFAPKFTATSASGLAILFASISLLIIGIYYTKNLTSRTTKVPLKTKEYNPLEEAIAALINDFIKEREFKRTNTHKMQEKYSPLSEGESSKIH